MSYILVVEFVFCHASSEDLLLHLQDRSFLSTQPLLLGILQNNQNLIQQHVKIENMIRRSFFVCLTLTACRFLISCLQSNSSL